MCFSSLVHYVSSLVHHEMLPSWSVMRPPLTPSQRNAGRWQPIRGTTPALIRLPTLEKIELLKWVLKWL